MLQMYTTKAQCPKSCNVLNKLTAPNVSNKPSLITVT